MKGEKNREEEEEKREKEKREESESLLRLHHQTHQTKYHKFLNKEKVIGKQTKTKKDFLINSFIPMETRGRKEILKMNS